MISNEHTNEGSWKGEGLVIQEAQENLLQIYEEISIVDNLCYSAKV